MQFKKAGYHILDEAFMELPEYALHPQTLVMETVWIANWFMRLLKMSATIENSDSTIFIADRSPYSAEYYAPNGHLLGPIIKEQIKELTTKNIHIYTVLLTVDKELLWARIQERLQREPFREKYHENDRSWMEKTYDWYQNHEWDFIIENGKCSISSTQISLIKLLMTYAKDHDEQCWTDHGLFNSHTDDSEVCLCS